MNATIALRRGRLRAPRAGFTLVEMLLAVLILAIIMAIVYGVVVSTLQAQQEIEGIMRQTEIGPMLLAQIRQDLEGAFLPDEEGQYFAGYSRPGGTGERDRIDFITTRLGYGAERELDPPRFHSVNEVGYQVRNSPTDASAGILYRRIDFFLDEEPLKGGRLTEVYDGVQHFDVRYWVQGEWQETWDPAQNVGKLPEAVKVEIRYVVRLEDDKRAERTVSTIVTYPPPPPTGREGAASEPAPASPQTPPRSRPPRGR